jgi:hypothetical protein
MTKNGSGKAQRDNPVPGRHPADVRSETLEPEGIGDFRVIPGRRMDLPADWGT